MRRRTLVKGLCAGLPLAAGVVSAAARQTKEATQQQGTAACDALKRQIEDLKRRFDETDQRNRKHLKIAVTLAALSLGLDLTAWL